MSNSAITAKADDRRLRIGDEKYLYDIASYKNFIQSSIFSYQKRPKFQIQESLLLPAQAYLSRPASLVPSKLVFSGVNRARSPIFTSKWLKDGVHLVTGASSGEISLWNAIKYHQELNFPAHDCAIRTIAVSHNGSWLISADHNGQFKYWQPNLNLVSTWSGHSDPVRGVCFAPTDIKFASCSDDGLIKIWDFETNSCETSMQGHGTDVKCLDWHPSKGLIVSGSKDSQQPIMLWDPRVSSALCTIHIHKNAIMSVGWNCSGNLFASASKDKTVKLFDIRVMKEFQVLRAHKKEPYHLVWHPLSERILSSASVDGSMIHWLAGEEKELLFIDSAHDGVVWELSWHHEGHLFSSVSNDQSTKIWMRNGPQKIEGLHSDKVKDDLPASDNQKSVIPLKDRCWKDESSETEHCKKRSKYPLKSLHQKYPSPRYPLFRCCPVEPQKQKDKFNQKLPVGVCPVEEQPSTFQVDADIEYIFDGSANFREPVKVQMQTIFDVSDEEISPFQFSSPQQILNYIPPETLENIYKNFYLDLNAEQRVQENRGSPVYGRLQIAQHESEIRSNRSYPSNDDDCHINKTGYGAPNPRRRTKS